ncbi:MAG: hypothetical protein KGS47_09425 [Chloroflexi bacterium]|jgi:hypothetical protein|nr:hypothetical protein [Chloroflexota bacterium]
MESNKHARYLVFALGAAVGSAIGIVIGALLTFWIGEETLRTVQRLTRRIAGSDEQPNFEMLMQ